MLPLPCLLVSLLLGQGADVTSYVSGGLRITHAPSDEGLLYAPPATGLAYNTQVIRDGNTYHTVYHSEPRKTVGKGFPGDSIRAGSQHGAFTYEMPPTAFVLWGHPTDTQSILYSPEKHGVEGWGGVGNPMTVRGVPGDDYYYIFGVAVHDDHDDPVGSAQRHYLCPFRTRDFRCFDVRTTIEGTPAWHPFTEEAPPEAVRPMPVRDVSGELVRSKRATSAGASQGLIGSICRAEGYYYFFYTDLSPAGETYLYYRTTRDPAAPDSWSEERMANDHPMMEGTIVRVAKARGMKRWAVLYNGYKHMSGALRPDLMLQYTSNLRVEGEGGLSDIVFFQTFEGSHGIHDSAGLGLASGTVFAQHYFMTDPYGGLDVPAEESPNQRRGGMLTWTDLAPGVYGSKVYRAGWEVE